MKKFLIAAAGLVALTISASAADMAARPMYAKAAPPVVAPVLNWNGLYIGINGGGAWGRSEHDFTTGIGRTGAWNISGGLVGGTVGFNWMAGPSWLLGLEGDFDWANVSGNFAGLGCNSGNCFTNVQSLATIRGRLGFLATNSVLLYVTGGFAAGNVRAGVFNSNDVGTVTHTGWTVGGGLEWMFAPAWSAKAEYLWVDLRNPVNYTTAGGIPTRANVTMGVGRLGVNYHF